MKKSIVKHHNDLNTVVMRKWTSQEMNFFFKIITECKNEGTSLLKFNLNELKNELEPSNRENARWNDTVEKCVKKVSQLVYFEKTESTFKAMPLFAFFECDYKKEILKVELSKYYEYILNRLSANFTTYELEEFTSIRSTYAKTIYRLLKQWRTTGRKEFTIEEFKVLLDISKYYQICDIDRLAIKPILKELSTYFRNLKVKKVKSNKRGNPVVAYEFIWEAEEIKSIPKKKKI